MFSSRFRSAILTGLGVASTLLVASCDPEPGFRAQDAELSMSLRWDCCSPGAAAGYSVRLSVSLPGAEMSATDDCPRLPAGVQLVVNGQSATVIDPGGPQLGGESGTDAKGCHRQAFAEAGPFPSFAGNQVSVELRHDGHTSRAVFDKVLPGEAAGLEAKAVDPSSGIRVGDEAVVAGKGLDFIARRPTIAEVYFADGQLQRSHSEWASLKSDGVHFRAGGLPGAAFVVIHLEPSSFSPEGGGQALGASGCEGLRACRGFDASAIGPMPLQLLP